MDASLLWPPGLLLVGVALGFGLMRSGRVRVFWAVGLSVLLGILALLVAGWIVPGWDGLLLRILALWLGLPGLVGLGLGGWRGRGPGRGA